VAATFGLPPRRGPHRGQRSTYPRPIDRTRVDVLRKVQGINNATKGHSDSAGPMASIHPATTTSPRQLEQDLGVGGALDLREQRPADREDQVALWSGPLEARRTVFSVTLP
jgi:hypothetical protein